MMLHRHFEARKAKLVPKKDMDVKEGEDMLTAPAEEHQTEPDPESKPARRRKRNE